MTRDVILLSEMAVSRFDCVYIFRRGGQGVNRFATKFIADLPLSVAGYISGIHALTQDVRLKSFDECNDSGEITPNKFSIFCLVERGIYAILYIICAFYSGSTSVGLGGGFSPRTLRFLCIFRFAGTKWNDMHGDIAELNADFKIMGGRSVLGAMVDGEIYDKMCRKYPSEVYQSRDLLSKGERESHLFIFRWSKPCRFLHVLASGGDEEEEEIKTPFKEQMSLLVKKKVEWSMSLRVKKWEGVEFCSPYSVSLFGEVLRGKTLINNIYIFM